mgnify:CR=1 FL=1
MSFDLTNKNIQDTFQNLLQRTGSDNRLYDLLGNEIGDLRISGSLTAQQYIVSSSVTNISIATLSGSTTFGNSLDDTHTFIGNITSSGTISASGGIFSGAHYFNVSPNDDFIFYHPPSDAIAIQSQDININASNGVGIGYGVTQNNSAKLNVNGNINTNSHITASGNISASGNLTTIQITSSGHFIGQLPPDGGDNVLRYLKTSGDATAVKIEMGDLTGDAGGGTKLVLDDDATKVDITGNLLVSGILSSSGDLTSRGGTIERGLVINNDGGAFAAVIKGNTDDNLFLANVTPSGIDKVAIGTNSFLSKLTINGDLTTTSHITASGNISGSGGNILGFNSASFNYITASVIDVDGSTIRMGGEPFTKANIQALKQGKSLKALGPGKVNPDILGGDITASGDMKINGDVLNSKVVQMTNSSSVIDTFNTGSFRSAKYILQVTSASNYQVSEMLVLHNDGTPLNTEYAQLNSGLNLVNFSTDINGANVRLNASGNFISCSVRHERTIIPN